MCECNLNVGVCTVSLIQKQNLPKYDDEYKENIDLYEQISVKEIQNTNNNSAILSQKSVEIELLKTQLKFQKIKTIFASATGFVTTIFFSYLWIIK